MSAVIDGSFDPPVGAAIPRLAHITFQTFDGGGLVQATFDDGAQELVWSPEGFSALYAAGSFVEFSFDRFYFTVRRVGGWRTARVRLDVVVDIEDSDADDLAALI